MKDVPGWVKFAFGVLVVVSGWIYAFASDSGASKAEMTQLKKDVASLQQELKDYNIAVISNEMKHLTKSVEANNEQLKEFNKLLSGLQ